MRAISLIFFFFFNDTATTEIYTLSLHDALPISPLRYSAVAPSAETVCGKVNERVRSEEHTLNSSHSQISYAVFCLKKKKQQPHTLTLTEQSSDSISPRVRSIFSLSAALLLSALY